MAMLNGRLVSSALAAAPDEDDDWMPEGARVVADEDDWMPEGAKLVERKSASAATEKPSLLDTVRKKARSGMLGFGQGASFGFLEELASKAADLAGAGGEAIRPGADATPELRAAIQAQPTFGQRLKGAMRADIKRAAQEDPEMYIPGEVAGNLASTYLGGEALSALGKAAPVAGKGLQALATWAKANPWKAVALGGATQGGLNGAGASEADTAGGVVEDTALGTLVGAGAGLAGHGISRGLGAGVKALRGRAQKGIEVATGQIDDMAKAAAAEQTASARSAAGRAAQDAYKQLEHLRALDRLGMLSPEEKTVADALASELADKAQANLLPAAAEKAAKSEAYKEAMATEAGRAAEKAKEIGSVWNQLKPRLKRYAIPLAAGVMGLPAGGPVGAGVAAAAGRGVSPAIQALGRMVKHPATRRAAWSLVGGGARAAESAAPVVEALRGPVSRAVQFEMDDPLIQALAEWRAQHEDADPEALAQAQALKSGR